MVVALGALCCHALHNEHASTYGLDHVDEGECDQTQCSAVVRVQALLSLRYTHT